MSLCLLLCVYPKSPMYVYWCRMRERQSGKFDIRFEIFAIRVWVCEKIDKREGKR